MTRIRKIVILEGGDNFVVFQRNRSFSTAIITKKLTVYLKSVNYIPMINADILKKGLLKNKNQICTASDLDFVNVHAENLNYLKRNVVCIPIYNEPCFSTRH